MQNLASFSKRLEKLTVDKALNALKELGFQIETPEDPLDDDALDALFELEDAEDFIAKLNELRAKRSPQKTAKKRTTSTPAAKRKASKKAESEATPAEVEGSAAAEDTSTRRARKKKTTTEAESGAEIETPTKPKRTRAKKKEPTVETLPEGAQIVGIVEDEVLPAAKVEPPETAAAVSPEAPTPVTPPSAVKGKPAAKPKPPKKKKEKEEEGLPIQIGAGEGPTEASVQIVLADGRTATLADVEEVLEPVLSKEPVDILGESSTAEKTTSAAARVGTTEPAVAHEGPRVPIPDPDVVADVLQRYHERRLKEKKSRGEAAETAPARSETLRTGKKTGKTDRKREKERRAERARLIDEEKRRQAAAAVREVTTGGGVGTPKRRKKTRDRISLEQETAETLEILEIEGKVTVDQLAQMLDIPVSDLILELMDENIMATKNHVLDLDLIQKVAAKHGFEVRLAISEEKEILEEEPDHPENLLPRPPVVTVMGHVDHGKTSLLDWIRKTKVAAQEAGGITQHIAAYEVDTPGGKIVFLDTPGHEAFTQMRARGAQITDLVVLVVAADDGVKPQTVEAIHHAQAAEVPIIVAINKCDKPDAQPDRVRQELTRYGLVDEKWGGNTTMVNISAKTGQGVDDLLDLLLLHAGLLELKANPKKAARGTVIEAEIARGLGPVAWVLVQKGTLRVGDVYVAGKTYGRVRSLYNSRHEMVEAATPGTPVLISGFNEPPEAGDSFIVVADERLARTVAEKRAERERMMSTEPSRHMTLEDFHARMSGQERKVLNLIIKADVQGSVDVLESSFKKFDTAEVMVNIVHAAVGDINESDILLADVSDAVIVGFNVTANPRASKLAEQRGVEIRFYPTIYEALDEVKKALEGLLTPEQKEVVLGHAEVRKVFRSSSLGNIAGCFQLDGETERGARVRVIRNGVVIHDGRIASIRREKDDVRNVQAGYECGIKIEKFDDIEEGDILECYKTETVARVL